MFQTPNRVLLGVLSKVRFTTCDPVDSTILSVPEPPGPTGAVTCTTQVAPAARDDPQAAELLVNPPVEVNDVNVIVLAVLLVTVTSCVVLGVT